jgi:3-isopropylmalate dehydrogenase
MPGDGVGPEVTAEALRVLDAVAALDGLDVEVRHFPHRVGYVDATGEQISAETIDVIAGYDALLFGAQGGPTDGRVPVGGRPLMAITERLDLSVGIRNVRLYAERLSPLRVPGGCFDITLVRDTSEDAFAVPGGVAHSGEDHEVSLGTLVYTRTAVDRALTVALEQAATRRGRLHLVTQVQGIAAHSIWHRRLEVLAVDFPAVEVETMLPDTAASQLVEGPGEFDVIVTTYQLGGILSNLMATVAGGVGLLPSGRINPVRRFGLFEPAHGTAPRHVGKETVSPVGAFRALAMLLDFTGSASSAARIEHAVASVLGSGQLRDVTTRSGVSTSGVTDIILDALDST